MDNDRLNLKELIGRATIHPLLFYSGKISGYLTWIILFLFIFGMNLFETYNTRLIILISYITTAVGFLFIIISSFNLGKSTRLGIPSENTILKTNGLYKISRNPMYVGFDLLTLSSILFTLHLIIIVLGLYSMLIYHLIILGEEKFLEIRFGEDYLKYKEKTRRYL